MKKRTAGFTLVELIVVIAILGILAGVAIPAYSGYISKAKEAADFQQLDAIKTAVVFAVVDAEHDADIQTITVKASSITYTANKAGTDTAITFTTEQTNAITAELKTLLAVETPGYTLKSGKTTATWTASTATWTFS